MRVAFLASGAFAQPTLRWLAQSQHEVALVVTQPAKGSGRGRHVTRTPVRALADELGLETLEAENVNAPDVIGRLRSLEAHVGLVIAFGQKLGPELLGMMPGGCINLHASLLPKYRGAAPINWAVVRGDEKTGCTVFRITERMDAGPILVSRWTEIKPEETAGELHDRLAGIGVDAMKAAVELFEGADVPAGTPQDERETTSAPKLSKTDGVVDFDRPASDVAHHICGMTPWPGASARFEASDDRWENVTFLRARRAQDPYAPADPPGTVDARRYVAARDGFVEILEIKPSSGRSMTWQDYVNGRHVSPGDRFTEP
ncbi:MAG: methionyl-tRNA formyltransferase [Planctomycetota bacterium]